MWNLKASKDFEAIFFLFAIKESPSDAVKKINTHTVWWKLLEWLTLKNEKVGQQKISIVDNLLTDQYDAIFVEIVRISIAALVKIYN